MCLEKLILICERLLDTLEVSNGQMEMNSLGHKSLAERAANDKKSSASAFPLESKKKVSRAFTFYFLFFQRSKKEKVTIKISGQLFPNWRESLAVSTPMGVEFHEPYFFWIVDIDGQVGVDKLDHWIFCTIERNQLCCIHTGKSNDKKIKW